jgi:hypothetical protein
VTHALVDSHVHFYGCYDRERFFDAAAANFSAAEQHLGLPPGGCWSLWLTETHDDDYFRTFAEGSDAGARWRVETTLEPIALEATREDGARILIVAGRQIETRERLEVLALGTAARFPRGMSLDQALRATVEADAVAVVPWGFGKWWFGRSRLLDRTLQSPPGAFHLGDSGGRPAAAYEPRHFRAARKRGLAVLPGSDPLPLPEDNDKVARYGFVLDPAPDTGSPAGALKGAMRRTSPSRRPKGRSEGIVRRMAPLSAPAGLPVSGAGSSTKP